MPTNQTDGTDHENTPVCIRVVVAYEDYDAGKRAQRTCQQILQLAHLEKSFSTDLWKFDMLELRAMREAATDEAADAALLVVAPHDDDNLPAGLREWIERSLLQPLRPKALLVLAGSPPRNHEEKTPTELQLERAAAQVNCAYWCLHLDPPDGAWSEPAYPMAELQPVAQALFAQSQVSHAPSSREFPAR